MKSNRVDNEFEPIVPNDLQIAFEAEPGAAATWKELTTISRRDYVSWINEAKQEETRNRRIQRCCENLLKGKKRPCCYAVVPMDFYKVLGASPEAKIQWSKLSANEKRDITDWIESSDTKENRKERIQMAKLALIEGKTCP